MPVFLSEDSYVAAIIIKHTCIKYNKYGRQRKCIYEMIINGP